MGILLHGLCTAATLMAASSLTQYRLSPDVQLLKEARLPTDGPGLCEFLRRQTPPAVEHARMAALVRQLADRSYKVRERATAALIELGRPALPLLRSALPHADLELTRRAELCVTHIERRTDPATLCAAVRLLSALWPDKASATLLTYLPQARDRSVTQEILLSLARLEVDGHGQPKPALLVTLKDDDRVKLIAALKDASQNAKKTHAYQLLALLRSKQLDRACLQNVLSPGAEKGVVTAKQERVNAERLLRLWAMALAEFRARKSAPK